MMTLCLLVPLMAAAQSWNEAEYKQIEQSIRLPRFADKEYVITKYGAKETNTAAGYAFLRDLYRRIRGAR